MSGHHGSLLASACAAPLNYGSRSADERIVALEREREQTRGVCAGPRFLRGSKDPRYVVNCSRD
jgi:hypothetical protein